MTQANTGTLADRILLSGPRKIPTLGVNSPEFLSVHLYLICGPHRSERPQNAHNKGLRTLVHRPPRPPSDHAVRGRAFRADLYCIRGQNQHNTKRIVSLSRVDEFQNFCCPLAKKTSCVLIPETSEQRLDGPSPLFLCPSSTRPPSRSTLCPLCPSPLQYTQPSPRRLQPSVP